MSCLSAPSGVPGSPPARHKEVGRSIRRWPAPTRSHHHAQLVHRQASWRTGRACWAACCARCVSLRAWWRRSGGLLHLRAWVRTSRAGRQATADLASLLCPIVNSPLAAGLRGLSLSLTDQGQRVSGPWLLALPPLICLLPLPHFCLRTRGRCTLSVPNVATTALSLSISSGKAAVPVASPPHPSNRQPKSAVAVIVTSVSTT